MRPRNITVALVVNSDVYSGGASNYEKNACQFLRQTFDSENIEFKVFVTSSGKNAQLSDGLYYKKRISDRLFAFALGSGPHWVHVLKLFGLKHSHFEKTLRRNAIDLAYFLSPNALAAVLSEMPLITTVWDLGHRDLPIFPEVSSNFQWFFRENYYRLTTGKSFHIFTDTDSTGAQLERIYGVATGRWSAVGLFPYTSPEFVNDDVKKERELGKYFIYPAQFWPHKNHVVLIEAMEKVSKDFPNVKLVFTGSNKGNKSYIDALISKKGLGEHVLNFGFVSNSDLTRLVENSCGLVMPSILGPSNIPPLEARMLGVPVVASNTHKFDENDEEIFLVDPLDADAWADQLKSLLAEKAKIRVRQQYPVNVEKFLSVLTNFAALRNLWG